MTLFSYELPAELSWKVFKGFYIKGWDIIYASVLALLHIFMSKKIVVAINIEDKAIVHNEDCIVLIKNYARETKLNEVGNRCKIFLGRICKIDACIQQKDQA